MTDTRPLLRSSLHSPSGWAHQCSLPPVCAESEEPSSRTSHHVKAGDSHIPALEVKPTILWGHLVAFQVPFLNVTLQNPSPVTTDLTWDSNYPGLSQHSPPIPHPTSFIGHTEVAGGC